jgi:hypothetical protein
MPEASGLGHGLSQGTLGKEPEQLRREARPARTRKATAALAVAVLVLTGCTGQPPGPLPGQRLRGYGTPSVSAYVPADQAASLQAMLDRCERVPRPPDPAETVGLPAACDQLHRTLHNQPGNAVRPTPGSGLR